MVYVNIKEPYLLKCNVTEQIDIGGLDQQNENSLTPLCHANCVGLNSMVPHEYEYNMIC